MDLPKDKGQTVISSGFGVLTVLATLDTKGTANLRDSPAATVVSHFFTLTTKVANQKHRAHSWSMV